MNLHHDDLPPRGSEPLPMTREEYLEGQVRLWMSRCAEARSVARDWEIKCSKLERECVALRQGVANLLRQGEAPR